MEEPLTGIVRPGDYEDLVPGKSAQPKQKDTFVVASAKPSPPHPAPALSPKKPTRSYVKAHKNMAVPAFSDIAKGANDVSELIGKLLKILSADGRSS